MYWMCNRGTSTTCTVFSITCTRLYRCMELIECTTHILDVYGCVTVVKVYTDRVHGCLKVIQYCTSMYGYDCHMCVTVPIKVTGTISTVTWATVDI